MFFSYFSTKKSLRFGWSNYKKNTLFRGQYLSPFSRMGVHDCRELLENVHISQCPLCRCNQLFSLVTREPPRLKTLSSLWPDCRPYFGMILLIGSRRTLTQLCQSHSLRVHYIKSKVNLITGESKVFYVYLIRLNKKVLKQFYWVSIKLGRLFPRFLN